MGHGFKPTGWAWLVAKTHVFAHQENANLSGNSWFLQIVWGLSRNHVELGFGSRLIL